MNNSDAMAKGDMTRRAWLATCGLGFAATRWHMLAMPVRGQVAADTSQVVNIGSRRELFIDRHLIDRLSGEARQQLHHPDPQEIVLVHDAAWEGTGSGYHSVFRDGDRYRMYYKAWHLQPTPGQLKSDAHPLYCCYAESGDGIHWRKPDLGLFEFDGSTNNNIVMTSGPLGALQVDAGHPAVFRDENPRAAEDARYKAIFRSSKPNGLLPFKSADGLRWLPITDEPVLTGLGAFDSQNLAFWDPAIEAYRAYWRYFVDGRRAIRTATSPDLVHWEPYSDLEYEDSPPEQLYTNQVKPYPRAPHLLIGFPSRYVERGWSESMRQLPEREHRELRASSVERYGTAVTEALLMCSRDGVHFKRWNEAFLRPGRERPGTWNYGHQYVAWQVVETVSTMDASLPELSLYATESYWTGKESALRRYTLRLDGFVSLAAPWAGGDVVTKPLRFDGSQLSLNFATSAAGRLRVELQEADGTPIPGFALNDCPDHFGDTHERVVTWNGGSQVSSLMGRPVRIRFSLQDADVYSFRFCPA